VESIFTRAKAVVHVVAGCIARRDRRASLPILGIDFNRIDQRGFLSERNELAMYQSFGRKLSSHVGGTERRIAAVQYYVSWSGDQQTKIGHRSNDTHDPERPFPNLVGFDWDRQVQASALRN
jgi:hypothetical protein